VARAVAALKAQRSISRKRLALVEYAGRHDAPSLTPGQSHTQELALTLPAGTYFLIVKADATSAVAEANETNNTQKAKKSS